MSIILNVIINILLMSFAIFSVLELVYDKSLNSVFFKKIRLRGWVLILFALLSVVFNLSKDLIAESKQVTSDKAKAKVDSLFKASQIEIAHLQISTKDSIIKSIDNTYIKSIKASNDALAKYNIKITDSLHSVGSKLKLNALSAQLSIAPIGGDNHPAFLDKDRKKLNIQFVSSGGTSYHVMVNCYLIEGTSLGYSILKSDELYLGEDFILEGVKSTVWTDISPVMLNYSEMLILLTGSFSKDPQGKIIIPFNTAFMFNFKENKYISKIDAKFNDIKKKLGIK